MLNSNYSTDRQVPIPVQKTLFGSNKFIGDTRQKLLHLYHKNPKAFKREIQMLTEYWCYYDGLEEVLEDRLEAFKIWCLNGATPPNTISRCHRALKEDGSIPLTDKEKEQRQEQGNQWKQYWGSEKGLREEE